MDNMDFKPAKMRIRQLLKEKGFTQRILGEKLGLTQGNVSRNLSEEGSGFFTVENLVRLSELLDVSVDYILTGKEEQKDSPEAGQQELTAKEICSMLYRIYSSCPFQIVEAEPRITLGQKYPDLKKESAVLSETPCLSIQFERPEVSDPFGWSDPVEEINPARSIAITAFLNKMRAVLNLPAGTDPDFTDRLIKSYLTDLTEESDVKKMLEPPLPF